ncbi:Hypothetical protein IALB_2561 [Ignavibacterium album JCM 16511]|uniref:Uncharacterized protein n=1 Tax=Ignavibacterium album (strain DSM 19864 / JCM 16511 / NBRC 101810 / Mat9-16) TaxID=945713 RepID=I0AMQ7_IGNAJ|nr:Hypothetical protein IALB_2561 [Ignavibacterium album JCM 16511]
MREDFVIVHTMTKINAYSLRVNIFLQKSFKMRKDCKKFLQLFTIKFFQDTICYFIQNLIGVVEPGFNFFSDNR